MSKKRQRHAAAAVVEEAGADEETLPPFLLKHGHRIVLAALTLLIFWWMVPEIRYASIFYNDAVSHSAIIKGMDQAFERGGNITDFWMDYINLGHALLRAYQFLFHLTIWIIHKTVLSWLSLNACFNVCITIMAMAMPWCVYKGCRLLGLTRSEAVLSAIGVAFVHEREGYGLGLTNYTYSGYGTYNQLYATLFFPFAIGYAHRLLTTGKGALAASLAFSATFMTHILMGYFACVWILVDTVFTLSTHRELLHIKQMFISLLKFIALVLLWTGHWVLPMARDTLLQHKSEFEAAWKWTGHGAEKMLGDFATGLILDADRWYPALTLVAGVGLIYCFIPWVTMIWRRGRRQSESELMRRQLFLQSCVWIALTFGPMTWGSILSILPFSGNLHWHRFFAGAQLSLMMGAGMVLAAALRRLDLRNNQIHLALTGVVATSILFPCLIERENYFYTTNTYWLKDTDEKWDLDTFRFHGMLQYALNHPDVRYYAGTPWNWGNNIKITGTIPLYALFVQNNVETIGAIHHHQSHSEVLAFKSNIFNPAHAELMNVRYVALENPPHVPVPSNYVPVARSLNAVLYDNGNKEGWFAVGPIGAMGSAVDDPPCSDNDTLSRTVNYYLSATKLPERHVYPPMRIAKNCDGRPTVDDLASKLANAPAEPIPGTIVSSSVEPGPNSQIYHATVNMTAPGLLLFKMNYHPGWQFVVDGEPHASMMVIPSLTAIKLEAGKHEITVSYQVAGFKRQLLWVFFAGVLGLLVIQGRRLYFYLKSRRSFQDKVAEG